MYRAADGYHLEAMATAVGFSKHLGARLSSLEHRGRMQPKACFGQRDLVPRVSIGEGRQAS